MLKLNRTHVKEKFNLTAKALAYKLEHHKPINLSFRKNEKEM